ncbi:ABC transporter ATP-binding protein [Beduini massiliensis]|uniref:ABC transporter ATP-binding protein n=1 Tax=Beduini massiliensis TaxID=1585974 RepID=UPI00059A9C85|nr:ABC transporter ATP-binding protein [Beduini massiliensis]
MIHVSNLCKYYLSGGKQTVALDHVSFDIKEGEFVVILGPSGAGKSTLLNILGGIDGLSEGEVLVDQQAIGQLSENALSFYRANLIGFIFQFYNLIPTLTVYENIALMKDIKKDILDPMYVLERVGLKMHAKKFPNQLSGGEQQRVSIARAVTKNPKVLLCDEPTGALDSETGSMVLQLLWDICREYRKTTIIVTHNASIAQAADKVITVKNGKIKDIQENAHPLSIQEVEW